MVREDNSSDGNRGAIQGVASGATEAASVGASSGPVPGIARAAQPAEGAVTATVTAAAMVPLCWPFPPGSQNHTDKAVKLKPYVPPKRRSLNQY